MFYVELNDFDLIKLKLPSKMELKCITEVNSKLYNDRIEDRISYKGCKFYDKPTFDGSPN